MAKRDKNRSYKEWEDDWSSYEQDDKKKELQINRRNKRNQKHNEAYPIINDDWNDSY